MFSSIRLSDSLQSNVKKNVRSRKLGYPTGETYFWRTVAGVCWGKEEWLSTATRHRAPSVPLWLPLRFLCRFLLNQPPEALCSIIYLRLSDVIFFGGDCSIWRSPFFHFIPCNGHSRPCYPDWKLSQYKIVNMYVTFFFLFPSMLIVGGYWCLRLLICVCNIFHI